jgi:catechol 2,3-dioxygenase-like lactoylglutathione lyase family enzyme
MKLGHVGLAVKKLEEAKAFWSDRGFVVEKEFEKDEPKARAAVLHDGSNGRLELWEFDQADTEFAKIVGRHIAFICDDVKTEAEKLKKHGFKEVIPFTQGVTLDYLFVQDEFSTFYELAQLKT